MGKKITSKEFKCEQCNYECKKYCTLKKHKSLKHTEKNCKVCSKNFKTTMGLISHVVQEHSERRISEDSVKVNVSKSVKQLKVQLKKVAKKNKSVKKLSCGLCDFNCKKISMLKNHMINNHQDHKREVIDECFIEDELFNLSEIRDHRTEKIKTKKSLYSVSPCWTSLTQ